MLFTNRNVLLHALGSIAFLSIPYISFTYLEMDKGILSVPHYQRNQISYVLLWLFFYMNYFYFIPKFYFTKKYVWLLGGILASFFIIKYLPRFFVDLEYCNSHNIDGTIKCAERKALHLNKDFRFLTLFLFILILSFVLRVSNQLAKIKSEKLKAEVSYLKAQINPHFLFNTLNSIYALTLEKSDEAPEAVLKLSSMMRYVVTESMVDFVGLDKELTYIKDYIALQQLRLDENTKVVFEIKGSGLGKQIAPLILISFIENAYKYGVNPDQQSTINIHIDINDKELYLQVGNQIVVDVLPEDLKTEKGISNTLKRLNYMYPNQHELKITNDLKQYHVSLKLNHI